MPEKTSSRLMQNFRFYLLLSLGSSVLGIIAVAWMWYLADKAFVPTEHQLLTMSMARENLKAKLALAGKDSIPECGQVATGVYLQSLNFHSANDVHISGYIWQKVPITPDCPVQAKAGFYFPEAVEGANELRKKYEYVQGNETLHGWIFETTVRQPFDYSKYPLDHQTVWLRILSNDFDGYSTLIPDLDAYPDTGIKSYFGLDSDIVLGDWLIDETFFDFKTATYHTNFGYQTATTELNPELHFNVVLKRKFINAFVVNLIPMLTVAALLFAVLLTISRKRSTLAFNGFSIMSVIGTISALFFVVILSHVNTRTKFPAQSIVYIEYFYLLLYIAMILVVLCSFIFNAPLNVQRKLVMHDFMLPKLIYWPSLLLAMLLISYWALF